MLWVRITAYPLTSSLEGGSPIAVPIASLLFPGTAPGATAFDKPRLEAGRVVVCAPWASRPRRSWLLSGWAPEFLALGPQGALQLGLGHRPQRGLFIKWGQSWARTYNSLPKRCWRKPGSRFVFFPLALKVRIQIVFMDRLTAGDHKGLVPGWVVPSKCLSEHLLLNAQNIQRTSRMQRGNRGKGAHKPCPQGASSPERVAQPLTSGAPNLLGEIPRQPSWSPQSNGGGIG